MTGISIGVVRRLNEAADAAIRSLAETAERADGVAPLPEQVLLHLKHPGEADAWHFVARRLSESADQGSMLIGYGYLDKSNPEEGPTAEIVVAPESRRQGVGGALLDALRMKVRRGDKPVRVWAHGALPAAAALAAKRGLKPVRELWVLSRPLDEVPTPALPDGIRLAAFRPGVDDKAWVAVNARAFAHHPEQGSMTVEDLRERMAEPWFDPEGFFLAWRGAKLAGFHWTKVHDHSVHSAHGDGPVGEVYVLGMDPDEQGSGLGRPLTQVGLRYLRDRGLKEVILYVEADNAPAVALYTKLGFTRRSADIMYQV